MNLRTFRPRYFIRRVGQIVYRNRHPNVPWLSPGAILLLSEWLKPADVGLEWGSGRSTAWFARRVKHLTSVEHNPEWVTQVRGRLQKEGLQEKVNLRHIDCDLKDGQEPDDHPYAAVAHAFADGSLDFALVDGAIRLLCMRYAMPKIKPGGLLILDNANRYLPNLFDGGHSTVHELRTEPRTENWKRLAVELRDWRAINTSDGIWDTRFWVKPAP